MTHAPAAAVRNTNTVVESELTSVKLYLFRHSIAEMQNPQGDRYRCLTPRGHHAAQSLFQQVLARKVNFDLILASPYVRALETAEHFIPLSINKEIQKLSALVPEASVEEAFDEIGLYSQQGFLHVAVFSHNPLITYLCQTCLPMTHGGVDFTPPTVAALEMNHPPHMYEGHLLWIESF